MVIDAMPNVVSKHETVCPGSKLLKIEVPSRGHHLGDRLYKQNDAANAAKHEFGNEEHYFNDQHNKQILFSSEMLHPHGFLPTALKTAPRLTTNEEMLLL